MRKALLLLTLAATLTAWAVPDFEDGKKYHIVCVQFPNGCVADGATVGEATPLYYLQEATTNSETYWRFTDKGDGQFTIRNNKTRQYITYDGVRQDSPELRRYVSMTEAQDGDNSLWTFVHQGDGVYAIRNVAETSHIWDVRVDSYCVGTYAKTDGANQNQRFFILDEEGNQVEEKQETPVTADGYDVSSWLDHTTDNLEGWTATGSWSLNTGAGGAHWGNDGSYLVAPFIESWHESAYGPLDDSSLSQKLYNLPAGKYVLQADMMAVRQGYSSWYGSQATEPATNVTLYANQATTPVATGNDPPQRFQVAFTLTATGEVALGVEVKETNANWIAIDNVALFFQGTEKQLIDGEKAKIKAELADYYGAAELNQLINACNNDFDALEELRHSADVLPSLDPLQQGAKNLTIAGQSLAWVESTDLYLASTEEQNFGTDYTAVIDYQLADGWDTLKINGTKVAPGSEYKFAKVTAAKTYTFTMRKSDGSQSQAKRVTFTALPVVKIYGSFSNDYSEGTIQVMEPTMGYPAELLDMKAKWRGGITNGSGKHKRNYHVKLKDALGNKLEKKFFGLRNDNSWILESCQVDMSRVRNRVLTDLWNDFSTPPYYIGQEKKALTGTRGEFVELILNDEYRGIYCMTENMDRKQLKLKKVEETTDGDGNVTIKAEHGKLWKAKDWSYAVFMGPNRGHYRPADYLSTPYEYSDMWDSYQVKYPDFEDYGWQTDWSLLYDAVDFVCHTDDDNFREHVAEYFDIPVVMDYYILMECILATDNHGKNQFYAIYDKQVDKKITFAVWDMDATCGQRWSDDYYHSDIMSPEQDYARYINNNEHGENNLYKRLRDTDTDDFNMKMRLRYRDLRKTWLATDSILKRFSTYLDRFKKCGAAAREYNKWNGDSDISGLSLNFNTEMSFLTDWFTRRMNYLDTKRFDIASLPEETVTGDVNGDGSVDVADISSIITVMAGSAEGGDAADSKAADVNGDGTVDVADISSVITIMAEN